MPLNAVNLMSAGSFGAKVKSEGIEYTVVLHLGSNVALACRSADKFPAQVYLIAIDPAKGQNDAKENAESKGIHPDRDRRDPGDNINDGNGDHNQDPPPANGG